MKADYPLRFINSVANEFQKGKECGDESFIVPTSLFEIAKPLILVVCINADIGPLFFVIFLVFNFFVFHTKIEYLLFSYTIYTTHS